MADLEAALDVTRKAISRSHTKGKQQHANTVEQVASHLILLKSSTLSSAAIKKLVQLFRRPLVPLYSAFPLPSLQLSGAIFHKIYHEKFLAALGQQAHEQKTHAENILNSLLSGVLDFLDESETGSSTEKSKRVKAKDAIGTALYPALCEICFSLSAPMIGVELRCTAYALLSDSAAAHTANQQRLRDPALLGGERLGNAFWRTKDFLPMESLLNIFARILPSTKEAGSSRAKRSAFIRSVFVCPQLPETADAGQKVAELLEYVPSTEWEETSRRIVDVVAAASLAFPQPFAVNEVYACEQAMQCDRLYVDDKTLVANVLVGDDQCEALEVPFSSVRKITIESDNEAAGSDTRAVIEISEPPRLGKESVLKKVRREEHTQWTLEFKFGKTDLARFTKALQNRKLGKYVKNCIPPKLSLAKSATVLDFDHKGQPVKELSQSERIENVEQFYHTNQSSDDIHATSRDDAAAISKDLTFPLQDISSASGKKTVMKALYDDSTLTGRPHNAVAPSKDKATELQTPQSASDHNAESRDVSHAPAAQAVVSKPLSTSPRLSKESSSKASGALKRTESQIMRHEVFGASDEDLSDFSDSNSVTAALQTVRRSPRIKMQSSNKTIGSVRNPSSASRTSHARSAGGRRIIDSDDEISAIAPIGNIKSNKIRRKKMAISRTNDDPECDPSPTLAKENLVTPIHGSAPSPSVFVTPSKPSLGRVLSQLVLPSSPSSSPGHQAASAPARKPSEAVVNCDGSAMRSTRTNADRTLEMPDHISDVSVPAADVTPSVSRLITTKMPKPVSVGAMIQDEPPLSPVMDQMARSKTAKKPSLADMSDPISECSSPVPVPERKVERKSLKANLRKKDQALPDQTKAASHVKASKRKRDTAIDAHHHLDVSNSDQIELQPPRGKRPRKSDAELTPAVPPERTESQVLRPRATAATRAKKKYRGRKDRTSSPASALNQIDYDELPNGPPVEQSSSTPSSRLSAQAVHDKVKAACEKAEVSPAAPARKPRAAAKKNKENQPLPIKAVSDNCEVLDPLLEQTAEIGALQDSSRSERRETTQQPTKPAARKDGKDSRTSELKLEPARPRRRPAEAQKKEPNSPSVALSKPRTRINEKSEVHSAILDAAASKDKKPLKAPWADFNFSASPHRNVMTDIRDEDLANNVDVGEQNDVQEIDVLLPPAELARNQSDPNRANDTCDIELVENTSEINGDGHISPREGEYQASATRSSRGAVSSRQNTREHDSAVLTAEEEDLTLVDVVKSVLKQQHTQLKYDTVSHAQKSRQPPILKYTKEQTETIDLTEDSPFAKVPTKKKPSRASPKLDLLDLDSVEISTSTPFKVVTLPEREVSPVPARKSRPKHSVTFATTIEEHYSSPDDEELTRRDAPSGAFIKSKLDTAFSPSSIINKGASTKDSKLDQGSRSMNARSSRQTKEAGIQDIVDVLDEIQQAILRKVTQKFDGVREEVRHGRDALIADATNDLLEMRAESVNHFNHLIDLEAEYAKFGRITTSGFEDMRKLNEEICVSIKKTIEGHDRSSLSKRMPKMGSLPIIIQQNFQR
ncbi:uncharacterized protein LAESUDRAFT_815615 [Laetiporus sulphureus 93-53]|uniref:Uncharacterized protein n=1 Tax=Laetiporus sulphureus 93-53 TaxID=1314785 RepID=A0A165C150_9APHY|nr:uncharacterized protein LAESUDRAFT_815615 [Laetiporus sulphureus 93-53]KZT02012.1 hypothetical protein LAESUDRAFT_815615 [Laetiporus sulphureus 93-53]